VRGSRRCSWCRGGRSAIDYLQIPRSGQNRAMHQTLRDIGIGGAKLAVGLLLVILLVVGVLAFASESERRENARLYEPRLWPSQRLASLDSVSANLVSRWRGGVCHFQFEIAGRSSTIDYAIGRADDRFGAPDPRTHGFALSFLDDAGFEIIRHHIPAASFTRTPDPASSLTRWTRRGSFLCTRDQYRRAVRLDVSWRL
jgi:hypothetical protein